MKRYAIFSILLAVGLLMPNTSMPMWARIKTAAARVTACAKQAVQKITPSDTNPLWVGIKYAANKVKKINTEFNALFARKPIATTLGISAAAQAGAHIFYGHKANKLPDAPPLVQKFAQEQLKAVGIDKPIQIKMDSSFQEGNAATDGRSVFIGTGKTHSRLNNLLTSVKTLEDTNQEDDDLYPLYKRQLDWYAAMFQHEGTHIQKYHSLRASAAIGTAVLASHYTLNSLRLKPFAGTCASTLVHRLATPFSIAMVAAAYFAHGYHAEQQADDGIQNFPPLLQASADMHKNSVPHHKTTLQALKDGEYKHALGMAFDVHPHPAQRAARFEQRIATLKQQAATSN